MFRVSLLALALGLATSAQSPAPLMTPGDVVLPTLRPAQEIRPTLAAAVRHPAALVRTAAARVAAVKNDRALSSSVAQALEEETDENAAAEQVRALLLLDGSGAIATVDRSVRRVGGRTVVVLAEWLARNQPGELATRVTQFSAAAPWPSISPR
jgi:hypothetical protein